MTKQRTHKPVAGGTPVDRPVGRLVEQRTYTRTQLLTAIETERHACSIAVWMALHDALAEDADDKGLDGWMREAEQRIKNRSLNDPDLRAISRPSTPDGWSDTDWIAHLRREAACPAYAKGPLPETGWD
jgi:hypothetical protein